MQRRASDQLAVRGDLQADIMAILWKRGEATVEDVRRAHPAERAYTTLQTVMNRLVERGLLERERRGRGFVYRPCYDEATHLTGHIRDQLASAPPDIRRAALRTLVGQLDVAELDEVARYANRIKRARRGAD